ncbi:MAG: transglutaminase domain-containing protein [Propionibacteriaceae bacterium]|nr:transglutaminase domain-containing protein [Propionibacteriaceae bacterium]
MKTKKLWPLLTAVGATVPVALAAPRPEKHGGIQTIDELVDELRASGAAGRDLVDLAISRVAREYTHHSAWHLWEHPETSLRNGRGWSHQYNTVLLVVLRRLGFEARMVQASRVRGFHHPWWHVGHAWVKVVVAGRRYDACASRATNQAGNVGFVPVTAEVPFRTVTRWAMGLFLMPFVTATVWRAWLTGRPVPDWVYRRRD